MRAQPRRILCVTRAAAIGLVIARQPERIVSTSERGFTAPNVRCTLHEREMWTRAREFKVGQKPPNSSNGTVRCTKLPHPHYAVLHRIELCGLSVTV
jgi:hypothetical protein